MDVGSLGKPDNERAPDPDGSTARTPSPLSLLRFEAGGAAVFGLYAVGAGLGPSLASRGRPSGDGVFGAASIAFAGSIAKDVLPTSPGLQSAGPLEGSAYWPLCGQSVSVAQAESLRVDATGVRNAGRLVLVANLVVLGWVTALRCGRLEATNVRGGPVS